MLLPRCVSVSDPNTQLEMVLWLTPTGRPLDQSNVFAARSDSLKIGVTHLLAATSVNALDPVSLARNLHSAPGDSLRIFSDVAGALLVLTGQSDNNLKCQFPVYLIREDQDEARSIMGVRRPTVSKPFLSPIKLETVTAKMRKLSKNDSTILMSAYFNCLLERADLDRLHTSLTFLGSGADDEAGVKALDSILDVMALGASRGSATASGGHDPEKELRETMSRWGLLSGRDFNLADVTADELRDIAGVPSQTTTTSTTIKSRAFDFTVPYRTPGWKPALLVQCQFYAGDSGSVSHKNVDQTSTSRRTARSLLPKAAFGEFLDGAGYVTALKGDAQKLLAMDDTSFVVQLRTAPLRLRQALQESGFCTSLDLAHYSMMNGGTGAARVIARAEKDYGTTEAQRAFSVAVDDGWLEPDGTVVAEHFEASLQFLVLDALATLAATSRDACEGFVVPGYGAHDHGIAAGAVQERLATLLPPSALPTTHDTTNILNQWVEEGVVRQVGRVTQSR